jgi:hypothetical protein
MCPGRWSRQGPAGVRGDSYQGLGLQDEERGCQMSKFPDLSWDSMRSGARPMNRPYAHSLYRSCDCHACDMCESTIETLGHSNPASLHGGSRSDQSFKGAEEDRDKVMA